MTMAFVGHAAAQHFYLTGLYCTGTGNKRKEAQLSDSIWTDYADHTAGRHIDVNGIKCKGLAIAQANLPQSGHGR